MAGPVFVIDAAQQPLMPLAEAHARKLLHTGKASRWPHPTLTIIQLTRIIERPTLRPILLGVRLHQKVAELFLVAAGPERVFPLLSVVVDLTDTPYTPQRRRTRYRRQAFRMPWKPIRQIRTVVNTLRTLLPLSHIVILRPVGLHAVPLNFAQRLRRALLVNGVQVTVIAEPTAIPSGMPPGLFAMFIEMLTQTTAQMPMIVARVLAPPQQTVQLSQLIEDNATAIYPGIGVVTTLALAGIIDARSTKARIELQVPIAVDASDVIWRSVTIPLDAPFQRWPLTPVVLLPLVLPEVQLQLQLHTTVGESCDK
jgi:hypothetical protein